MDRNQATGLILIAAMLITYFTFFAPKPKQLERPEAQEEVLDKAPQEAIISKKTENILSSELSDSLVTAENKIKFGAFAYGATGVEEDVVLENDLVAITLSTKGASIKGVVLKKFNAYNGNLVQLINENNSQFMTNIMSFGKSIDLNALFYTIEKSDAGITFTLQLPDGGKVKHQYSLAADSYELKYNLTFVNLEDNITSEYVELFWKEDMIPQEQDLEMSRINSTVNYYSLSDGFDELSERSLSLEEEKVNEPLKWATFKQRFFLSALIADKSFAKGEFSSVADINNDNVVKTAKLKLSIPVVDAKESDGAQLKYYFGPNDYHITGEVAQDFSKNLWLGYPPMLWVNKYVLIPLFDLLNNVFNNYGLIIILIVLIIKLILSPLSYKSYLSMAKMKVLKPELDEIKEKHGGDMAKAQQDQLKLYQQVGVSPISGCLPMLLQMPILLAMFYFFPQSIELRGEAFLWANDLSNYDSILDLPFTIPFYGNHVSLFVLLMTGSTILITYSQQQVSSVQGPMKSLSYMMPVIFMFVLNSYPAALSFYYFVSNLVTYGQQVLIRRFVDEEKIRKILDENKKNAGNRKKSKFQQKLEEAMKAQQKNKGKK